MNDDHNWEHYPLYMVADSERSVNCVVDGVGHPRYQNHTYTNHVGQEA